MTGLSTTRRKVVVAMSGGVDSSVAACLLREQGYDVTGLFMRIGMKGPEPGQQASSEEESGTSTISRDRGCCSAADAADARAVAGMLDIPFYALNFKNEFGRIIDYFIDEYRRGRTPNPCVLCNEQLKFGRLADYARAVGADFIATGHYARIERMGDDHRLCRGVDPGKDQSYVLFGIGQPILARTLLPIGQMRKDEVRAQARRFGLSLSNKPDSQDICFVPDRDYARLVYERYPDAFIEGPIVDRHGNELGRHDGIVKFTIGQRRGLGVAAGKPIYVTRIDPNSNTVTVGSREDLARDHLIATHMRWLGEEPVAPFRAQVKIRYAHQAAPATVIPQSDHRVSVHFDTPQNAVTPGQAAVLYDNDVVLGGGWIE